MTAAAAPRFDRSSTACGAAALALAAASAAFTLLVVTPGYVIDDAFIGFRYARNLWEGHGLVFNPGEPVEGYTSFLWVLWSALAFPLGLQPIALAQGTSVAAQMATIVLAYRMGLRCGRTPPQALLAPALLATHITLLTYPMTGMDTSLICLLVTLAVYLAMNGLPARRTALGFGLVVAAIVLTRFDGFVMAGILFCFLLVVRREVRPWLPAAALVVAAFAAYNAWRLWTYPSLLPNTFHAKMMFSAERTATGLGYLMRLFTAGGQFTVLLALLPFVLGRAGRPVWLMGWVVAMHLLYVVVVGGDWMPFFRFVLPVLAVLMVLAQEGVFTLWERIRPAEHRLQRAACAAALLLLAGFHLTNLTAGMLGSYRPRLTDVTGQLLARVGGWMFHPRDAALIGRAVEREVPRDWLVATEWAGIIPYSCHQRALDLLALNDADMVRHDFPTSTIGMFPTADYVAGRRPHLVVAMGALQPTAEAALAAARRRLREGLGANSGGGTWIADLYGGLHDRFGYKLRTLPVAGRHWAFLLRGDLSWPPATTPDGRR